MNTPEKIHLEWKDFKDNITNKLGLLREDIDFADVTLACEDGQQVEAHKVILAASSPLFHNLLKMNKHPHPLIYMRGMKSEDFLALVDFLYHGEVDIDEANLNRFLALADELKLKGLTGVSKDIITEYNISVPPVGQIKDKTKTKELDRKEDISFFELKQESSFIGVPHEETRSDRQIPDELQALDKKIKSMWVLSLKNGAKIYTCQVCGKETKYNNNMRDHIETHHFEGVSIPCNICDKVLRSKAAFRTHKQRKHD